MMLLWNNGFECLSHEVGAAVDPTDERPVLVARFARFIIQELLQAHASRELLLSAVVSSY